MRSSAKWLLLFSLMVCGSIANWGCDQTPQLDPEQPENTPVKPQASDDAAPTAPTTRSTGIVLGGVADDLRRKAEGGDVQSMLVLGRFLETRNTEADRAEARKWYEKAAASGDASAKDAVKAMDARAKAMMGEDDEVTTTAPVAQATTAPSEQPARRASTRPRDPSKVAWDEVIESIDPTGFAIGVKNNHQGKFVALAMSPDKTITIAAAGDKGDDLEGVSIVMRIRNRQDPANSIRVMQTAAIANHVTRENVTQREIVDWIKQYLATNQKSEPIFRNGWRITVTGPAAEGIKDDKEHLGAGVMVELKR